MALPVRCRSGSVAANDGRDQSKGRSFVHSWDDSGDRARNSVVAKAATVPCGGTQRKISQKLKRTVWAMKE
jgi:hypothetical protein